MGIADPQLPTLQQLFTSAFSNGQRMARLELARRNLQLRRFLVDRRRSLEATHGVTPFYMVIAMGSVTEDDVDLLAIYVTQKRRLPKLPRRIRRALAELADFEKLETDPRLSYVLRYAAAIGEDPFAMNRPG